MSTYKKRYTLGLCTMGTSAAALFKDGKLIAAVEEERLTRIKNDNSFPHLAIKEVLEIEEIQLSEISEIAVYWQPWRVTARIVGTTKKAFASQNSRRSIMTRLKKIFTPSEFSNDGSWTDLFNIKKILVDKHGFFNGKISFYDHHLTHQKYGESIKGWKDFISLSYDGGGESDSTVLSVVINGNKKVLSRHKWPNSLGHFYSTFTGFLGFKMLEGEYKMMGLAPYGKPIYENLILSEILELKENGLYKLNTQVCDYHSALRGIFHEKLTSLFGPARLNNEAPSQKHIDLASSVQSAFESALLHILSPAINRYSNIKKLVITGGCALNVTANGKVLSSKYFDEIIIPPAPHDAGCAIGAAICLIRNEVDLKSISNPYLGRNFSQENICKEISTYCKKIPMRLEENQLIENTVKYLIEGKLIAWFQGSAEFGPRALGARSFLADPRNDDIRDQINSKIKKRELFRPFAPSATEDSIGKIFDLNQSSPYMNIVSNVLNTSIPAVTHIDGTARVHTVTPESHNRYHKLITCFGEKTGIPVLLNTSFNIQEPIVYSPKNAIETYINSKVDILVIGDYIINREDLKNN